MIVSSISVTGVRNLHPVTLKLSSKINIFFGENGSGKTSLLESVYFLGLAKSFRTHHIDSMISDGFLEARVVSKLMSNGSMINMGVSRTRHQGMTARINEKNIKTAASLAEHLPIQLINTDDFGLLDGGSKQRRNFLDWGVFHLEPKFFNCWKDIRHILRQRNAYLRHDTLDEVSLCAWNHELANLAKQLDAYRVEYLAALKAVFKTVLAHLMPQMTDLDFSYYRGWDKEKSLESVLHSSLARDRRLGYTQAGPQRADLRLRVQGKNVVEVLSRGQQKLVVCAMRIAQAYLLAEKKQQKCVFLIDDLSAELDLNHQKALCELLERLEAQVFITCIDPGALKTIWLPETSVSMFHVEHGCIHPLELR